MINNNGNILVDSQKLISINNRGLNYGDALFETLKIVNGSIAFWEDHYFRLMASMRILRMEIPMNFSMEFLESEILKTIDESQHTSKNYRIKILISRKEGGKYTPRTNTIDYFIVSEKITNSYYSFNNHNYKVELFKDYYIPPGLLSTLKTTNKLIQILGSIYAKENNYDNCLLLNEKKQVVEALNGNIFLVKGDKIITPPLMDGCLKGILRTQIINICKKSAQFSIVEKSISPFDLQKVDELFITNVISGIQPVSNYRKKNYETTVADLLLEKLNTLLQKFN